MHVNNEKGQVETGKCITCPCIYTKPAHKEERKAMCIIGVRYFLDDVTAGQSKRYFV